jgi:hypothetical protein
MSAAAYTAAAGRDGDDQDNCRPTYGDRFAARAVGVASRLVGEPATKRAIRRPARGLIGFGARSAAGLTADNWLNVTYRKGALAAAASEPANGLAAFAWPAGPPAPWRRLGPNLSSAGSRLISTCSVE